MEKERVREILKEYEGHPFNKHYKKTYKDASKIAELSYLFIEKNQLRNYFLERYKKFKKPCYTEEEFIKMLLTTQYISEALRHDDWKVYKSPTEVVVTDIVRMLASADEIRINKRDETLIYESDNIVYKEYNDNSFLFIVDVNGENHCPKKDEEKAEHFKMYNIPFVQLKGTDVKNNPVGVLYVLLELMREVFPNVVPFRYGSKKATKCQIR